MSQIIPTRDDLTARILDAEARCKQTLDNADTWEAEILATDVIDILKGIRVT